MALSRLFLLSLIGSHVGAAPVTVVSPSYSQDNAPTRYSSTATPSTLPFLSRLAALVFGEAEDEDTLMASARYHTILSTEYGAPNQDPHGLSHIHTLATRDDTTDSKDSSTDTKRKHPKTKPNKHEHEHDDDEDEDEDDADADDKKKKKGKQGSGMSMVDIMLVGGMFIFAMLIGAFMGETCKQVGAEEVREAMREGAEAAMTGAGTATGSTATAPALVSASVTGTETAATSASTPSAATHPTAGTKTAKYDPTPDPQSDIPLQTLSSSSSAAAAAGPSSTLRSSMTSLFPSRSAPIHSAGPAHVTGGGVEYHGVLEADPDDILADADTAALLGRKGGDTAAMTLSPYPASSDDEDDFLEKRRA